MDCKGNEGEGEGEEGQSQREHDDNNERERRGRGLGQGSEEEENRNGAGTPRRNSGAPEAGKHGRQTLIRLQIYIAHLDSLSHVALRRGGHPVRLSCWPSPVKLTKLKQETSHSEPTSLRPLQAQKKSVPFSRHPYCLFMRIYSFTFTFGLRRHSPLFVCFFRRLPIGRSLRHSAGDGTPSRAKCTHCLSSGTDCIFTESTKVRSLLY